MVVDVGNRPRRTGGRAFTRWRFEVQMMTYRAVADPVRSAIDTQESEAMLTAIHDLRDAIGRHEQAIDDCAAPRGTPSFSRQLGRKGQPTWKTVV
jgi:hypothetical protein